MEADQVKEARRLIAWLWLGIVTCALILIIDLMLKRQIGRLAVEVGRARGPRDMGTPAHDADLSDGPGGVGVDDAPGVRKADGPADREGVAAQEPPPGRPPRRTGRDGRRTT